MTYLWQKIKSDIAVSVLLALLMIFVFCVSYFFLLSHSIRLDEAQTVWQTSRSFVGTIETVAKDVHVPLYYLAVRSWRLLFGPEIENIRILSTLFYVATIPFFYVLVAHSFTRKAAVLATILFSLSPFLHWYGSEARMYSMLVFFVVINQLAFIKIFLAKNSGYVWWSMYTLSALLGVLTHHFFAFILVAQTIFYIFKRNEFDKKSIYKFVSVGLTVAGLVGSWIIFGQLTGNNDTHPMLLQPTSVDVFNVFSQFIIGVQNDIYNTIFLALWPLFVLFIFLSIRHTKTSTTNSFLYFFILCALTPIVLALLVSVTVRPLFLSRYLIVSLPAVYALLGFYITAQENIFGKVMHVCVIGLVSVALFFQVTSTHTPLVENYRGAADLIASMAGVEDMVIISPPFTTYPIEYYYQGLAKLNTFPPWERFHATPIPPFEIEDLEKAVGEWQKVYQELFLVTSYDQGYEEELRIFLDTNLERIDHIELSPNLNVYRYTLRYDI